MRTLNMLWFCKRLVSQIALTDKDNLGVKSSAQTYKNLHQTHETYLKHQHSVYSLMGGVVVDVFSF